MTKNIVGGYRSAETRDSAVPRSYCACRNHSPDSVVIKEKPLLVLYLFVCCQMNILFHLALSSTTGNLLLSQPIQLIHQRIDLPVSCIDFAPESFYSPVKPLARSKHNPIAVTQSPPPIISEITCAMLGNSRMLPPQKKELTPIAKTPNPGILRALISVSLQYGLRLCANRPLFDLKLQEYLHEQGVRKTSDKTSIRVVCFRQLKIDPERQSEIDPPYIIKRLWNR
ncbi:MAG: hypothetical protein Q7V05_00955 [Methanoregula sp.]|nr:hypothetical protein [Methanoregula sp.]